DEFTVDGSYRRELRPNATHGLVGANYVNHEYAGSRGGYDSTTLYGGVDHNFNQNMLGNAQLGYSFSSIEGATSEDSTTPYLQAGLDYKITDRTSVNGTLGYSFYYAENSYFNAQDRLNIGLGAKHDLTGKITLSSTLSYTLSMFDSKYASENLATIQDYEEIYIRLSLRGSYQINRNNFVDVGYEISHRDVENEAAREYTRNRVDIGWRLRL
ncbi:MAG: outer membrane beta-barrel protein, partial [Verrucomicrobiota bacterium]